MPNSSLSHSVSTLSKPRDSASVSSTGRGLPCIHSGGWIPAMAQKVGARSTSPTGRVTTVGVLPSARVEGAGRQMRGIRISASTW